MGELAGRAHRIFIRRVLENVVPILAGIALVEAVALEAVGVTDRLQAALTDLIAVLIGVLAAGLKLEGFVRDYQEDYSKQEHEAE